MFSRALDYDVNTYCTSWTDPDYSVFSRTSSAKLVWAGVLLPPWVDTGVLFCGIDDCD